MGDSERETLGIECECGAKENVSASLAGRSVKCKICGKKIAVPSLQETQRDWRYMKDNQQVGPVSSSRMQEMLDAGVIGAQTLVWTEPMKEWTFASNVSAFRVKAAPVGPSTGTSPTRILLLVLIPILMIGLIAFLGIAAAIFLPALAKARESARRAACVNNLKQLGMLMNVFANENRGEYPRIDDVKGNLIFEGDWMYPEYLTDVSILGCPSDPGYDPATTFRLKGNSLHTDFEIGSPHADCVTSESYIYLGWAITNEEEGLAAIEAYRKASTEELDAHLIVPEGKGTGGGKIHRLSAGAGRFLITDVTVFQEGRPSSASAIPIMWEWPTNHVPAAGNVLYLDGHIEYIRYPGKFPMTERFIEALREMEPRFSPDVLPIVDK